MNFIFGGEPGSFDCWSVNSAGVHISPWTASSPRSEAAQNSLVLPLVLSLVPDPAFQSPTLAYDLIPYCGFVRLVASLGMEI